MPNYIITKPLRGNEICKEKGKTHYMQGVFTTFKSSISYGKLYRLDGSKMACK